MENPSEANDEGITALHNSICAGHFDIVQFLVEFGCDVNAADTDGWYDICYFPESIRAVVCRTIRSECLQLYSV